MTSFRTTVSVSLIAMSLVQLTTAALAQEFPVIEPEAIVQTGTQVALTPPPTESFSYQGYLESGGMAASGTYDFAVSVWDAQTSGSKIESFATLTSVPVSNGIFDLLLQTTTLKMQQVFNGRAAWIQVETRKSGTSTWTTLTRSPVAAGPYAWGLRPGTIVSGAFNSTTLLRLENTGTSGASALYAISNTPTGITIGGHHSGDGFGVYGSTGGGYPAVGGVNSGTGNGVYASAASGTAVHGSTSSGYGVVGVKSGYSIADNSTSTKTGGFFGGEIGAIGVSKYTNGYGLLGENQATSGSYTTGVVGRTSSSVGYGGHFSGGIALYARAVNNSTPDLVLAGNSYDYDNGWLRSDPAYGSSDLSISTNDDINIQLDSNADESGLFWLSSGDAPNTSIFQITEAGAVWAKSTITPNSNADAKEDFQDVDPEAILQALARMPLTSWRYLGEPERHVGPTAQDFRAAFGYGADDNGIATVDADGVALASIQGLYRLVEELQKDNTALKARIEALESER